MLSLNRLTAIAEAEGVSVRTVERDYVLTHLIRHLSGIEEARSLTFKGGTSLRLVHFHSFRYSADIDLNVDPDAMTVAETRDLLALAASQVETEIGMTIRFIEGELTDTGPRNQVKPERIKLDIAPDEVATDEPVRNPLIVRYADQSNAVSLPTYGLTEVTAEKLRCVLQRLQCRDLFDLHRLLVDEGVILDEAWPQYVKKTAHKGQDPTSLPRRWAKRIEAYQAQWDTEMPQYIAEVPSFDKVKRETERELRSVL